MVDEHNIIVYLWKILVTGALGFFAWFGKKTINDIDSVKIKANNNQLDLEKFKTHVAGEYEKKETVQSSLARVHDRIDDVGKDISDIKTLLINMGK